MRKQLEIVLLLIALSGCQIYYGIRTGDFTVDNQLSHAEKAEKLRKAQKFEAALAEYRLHFENRLGDKKRPTEENPYFYYLLIGDTYLDLQRPKEAREAYVTAKEHEVDIALVIDRIRRLSDYFVDKGEFDTATQTLKEFRDIDPDIFDADIDAVHKQMIATEDHYVR